MSIITFNAHKYYTACVELVEGQTSNVQSTYAEVYASRQEERSKVARFSCYLIILQSNYLPFKMELLAVSPSNRDIPRSLVLVSFNFVL